MSPFPKTRALISRLIGIIVGAGVVTAAVAIFNVVVFFVAKSTDIFAPPATVLSKLYTNSLMVQLNSRMRIMGSRDEVGNNIAQEIRDIVNSDPWSPTAAKIYRQSLAVPADRLGAVSGGENAISLNIITRKDNAVRRFNYNHRVAIKSKFNLIR